MQNHIFPPFQLKKGLTHWAICMCMSPVVWMIHIVLWVHWARILWVAECWTVQLVGADNSFGHGWQQPTWLHLIRASVSSCKFYICFGSTTPFTLPVLLASHIRTDCAWCHVLVGQCCQVFAKCARCMCLVLCAAQLPGLHQMAIAPVPVDTQADCSSSKPVKLVNLKQMMNNTPFEKTIE